MSTLSDQLLKMEKHNSIFEAAVRALPLPVCAAFGAATAPKAVSFAGTTRVLRTKDSDSVAKSFPNSVNASGNTVRDRRG